MVLSQTALYFAANVFSAALGLLNIVVFTRLFAPDQYGIYVLGMGFAIVLNTFLTSWLRLAIIREQARGDATDIRGLVLVGLGLSCLAGPLAYPAALLCGLGREAALAATALALMMGVFEVGLDILRARLQALTFTKGTIFRAVIVSGFGIAIVVLGKHGALLLCSTAVAYCASILVFAARIWRGATISFDIHRLMTLLKRGLPLTLSLSLLAVSNVIDRFIVAHLDGAGLAGEYGAAVDLTNQALIIPAISAASAFVPLAVQILAQNGRQAALQHLRESNEFLFAISVPVCLGFALTSHHIAALVFGAEFRDTAQLVMPIASIAIFFQILTYQYLHVSFLLSNRNSFYLWNTGSVIVLNWFLCYVLVDHFGVVGAAWSRLASTIIGFISALVLTRWAFPVPWPFARLARVLVAGLTMAILIRSIDASLEVSNIAALVILIVSGAIIYAAMCWLQDIASIRLRARTTLRLFFSLPTPGIGE
jgi:O-antigen/teichoic acid export membrane protein